MTARRLVSAALIPLAVCVLVASAVAAAAPKAAAPQPRYGGTLVVAAGDPGILNPAITSSGQAHPITGQIFNGLIRLDRNFRAQPDLARKWQISKDGRRYTFYLAQNARWHDGRRFTAHDVKYTYDEVLLKLHPRTRTLADVIDRVEVLRPHIVRFHLKHRYAPFMSWLDEDNGAILPRHVYQGTDPLTNPANTNPIGTGPFRFESYTRGDRVVLVRNPRYFKVGLPYLDRLVFRAMAAAPAAQAFDAGEVQLFMFPSGPDAVRLNGQRGVTVTERGREGFARVVPLILNTKRRPFDDVRVRQAMAHALDKGFIARTAYAGVLGPATSPLTRHIPWAYTNRVPQYPRNLVRARQLLDAAGVRAGGDGVRFRTSLIYDAAWSRQADLIKAQLAEVGIVVDLRLMEFNTWVQRLYVDKDFDMGYTNYTHPPDPDVGWKRIYVCSNIVAAPFTNGAQYCNPAVDRLFDRASRELNRRTRGELYRQAQAIVARDVPVIPLADGIGPWIYKSEFQGFANAGSKAPFAFGERVWWTKGTARRR
jgi:peptide/nickel transport system substrate-binding protein